MIFEFPAERLDKRDRPAPGSTGPDPMLYQAYDIRIRAGDTAWTSTDMDKNALPRCEVGGWDIHDSWDPNKIINDVIDGIMGKESETPVSRNL